ncbi:MAG: SocA family protein [Lentisphaeraceae bacterium]|nr:SocA family protein [Lentisphaeraceae bacterium]
MHTAKDIAASLIEFGNESGGAISPLKIQKLLYYAQGWHLALAGQALFSDDIEAWDHGPVCADVYTQFKQYGWNAIPTPANQDVNTLTDTAKAFIAKIWKAYGHYSGKALEEMTHIESPWKDSYDGTHGKVIPLDSIKKYFLAR